MQQLLQGEEASGSTIYISSAHTVLESRRSEIFGWKSSIPYTEHHKLIETLRLKDAGAWLFQKVEYQDWLASSASKLLLLRGIRKFRFT